MSNNWSIVDRHSLHDIHTVMPSISTQWVQPNRCTTNHNNHNVRAPHAWMRTVSNQGNTDDVRCNIRLVCIVGRVTSLICILDAIWCVYMKSDFNGCMNITIITGIRRDARILVNYMMPWMQPNIMHFHTAMYAPSIVKCIDSTDVGDARVSCYIVNSCADRWNCSRCTINPWY